MAVSTWGAGDLQDDWEEFLPTFDEVVLAGTLVAVMGLGELIGLIIDEDSQRNLTDARLNAWVKSLKPRLGV